jgi:hypothetical protein
MTLAEKLKQAEASAEAFRRELEVEQACSFATMLARAADAETAVSAARKAFADAGKAWVAHLVAANNGGARCGRAERGQTLRDDLHARHGALRDAAKARERALEDVRLAAAAAASVFLRATSEADRSMPKLSDYGG